MWEAEVQDSARLSYRPLQLRDAARIAALAGDLEVARMTARMPHPYTLVDADQWIGSLDDRTEMVRAIVLGGVLVGACGCAMHEAGSGEIGYWIGRPYWGHGYASEAARTLVEHCFAERGLSRLTCCHFVDNPASARVIAKLGFRLVGPCRAYCMARQTDVDTLTYELMRPDRPR